MLQSRAKAVIAKFKPRIIAITGSMGKTSTRQAITLVLQKKYKVRTAEKNFNNEIGVPLTILGLKSPGKNPFGWLALFLKSFFIKEYSEILVLEYGADHPGDIKKLCELAPPTVGVVTGVSPVHVEFFRDIELLISEKSEILRVLPTDGLGVINADDDRVSAMACNALTKKTYGTNNADILATDISVSTKPDDFYSPGDIFVTTTASVNLGGIKIGMLELNNAIGYAPVLSCLASLCVADFFGISFADALEILNSSFKAQPGRLNPLPGIKGSLIIDDSYNAAPAAVKNGLSVLSSFPLSRETNRRIAVLGNMVELGSYSQSEHRMIGLEVAQHVDLFLAVGEQMRYAVESAREAGLAQEAVEWFADSEEAGRYLDREIKTGDIVYVKGSQSSRMEKVVKDIMAEPAEAFRLLVRQDKKWLRL